MKVPGNTIIAKMGHIHIYYPKFKLNNVFKSYNSYVCPLKHIGLSCKICFFSAGNIVVLLPHFKTI